MKNTMFAASLVMLAISPSVQAAAIDDGFRNPPKSQFATKEYF